MATWPLVVRRDGAEEPIGTLALGRPAPWMPSEAAASTLGFRYLPELDAVYATHYAKSGEALERAYKRFLRSLDETDGG